MSAGQSNSVGTDAAFGSSKGSSETHGAQTNKSTTQFKDNSTTTTNVPAWARALNKEIATGNEASSVNARDFLSGLLSNPYDTSQPHNRYAEAINRNFDFQLARARGGTAQNGVARQGFREGSALTGAQDQSIGQGMSAANSLLTNASPMAALDWERLVAPQNKTDSGTAVTNTFGQTNQRTTTAGSERSNDKTRGHTSGSGITICCFIFLESYNGKLPWFVRKSRDHFCTGPRVEGYRKMSKHLVQIMRHSSLALWMVNLLLVWPLTLFGGWYWKAPALRYRIGWLMAPIVWFWFTVWSLLGSTINFEPNE